MDEFEGHSPLPGGERFGRHIVDPFGQPSGSPANFEELRGSTHVKGRSALAAITARSNATAQILSEFDAMEPNEDEIVVEIREPETPGDVPIVTRFVRRSDDSAE